ncbi:MAG: SMC-Scp complex subunit ScpB [Nitrososphaerota archaeon]|nr:SMC-Scp complex subunit ScpB [Nitrososphaerota archaeon]MDG7011023.1 SMC-Scp complex subunit ScpB [Nitrososphaerota archaeon]
MSEPPAEALPKELVAKVEAALYASGRPLTVEEIAKAAGTASERKAIAMAREIAKSVNGAMQAIEVVEYSGPRFAMQLRAKYTQTARKFATRPLLSRASLRTLSFIAFFQPITSSELALRRGSTVYQHLKELEEVGFIASERQGRARAYRTTARFAEYFGLSTELTALKRQLETRTLTLR